MPEKLAQTIRDLHARHVATVHNSKYALSRHPWDEPLENAAAAAANGGFDLLQPMIGEVVPLADTDRTERKWWKEIE